MVSDDPTLVQLGFRPLAEVECGAPGFAALPGLLLERDSKLLADRQQGGDSLTQGCVLYIRCLGECCANRPLELHSSGGCIYSGNAFEAHAGRSGRKKWRETIRVLPANVSLKSWLSSMGREPASRELDKVDPESPGEARRRDAVAAAAAAAALPADVSLSPAACEQQRQQQQPDPWPSLHTLKLLEQAAAAAAASQGGGGGGHNATPAVPLAVRSLPLPLPTAQQVPLVPKMQSAPPSLLPPTPISPHLQQPELQPAQGQQLQQQLAAALSSITEQLQRANPQLKVPQPAELEPKHATEQPTLQRSGKPAEQLPSAASGSPSLPATSSGSVGTLEPLVRALAALAETERAGQLLSQLQKQHEAVQPGGWVESRRLQQQLRPPSRPGLKPLQSLPLPRPANRLTNDASPPSISQLEAARVAELEKLVQLQQAALTSHAARLAELEQRLQDQAVQLSEQRRSIKQAWSLVSALEKAVSLMAADMVHDASPLGGKLGAEAALVDTAAALPALQQALATVAAKAGAGPQLPACSAPAAHGGSASMWGFGASASLDLPKEVLDVLTPTGGDELDQAGSTRTLLAPLAAAASAVAALASLGSGASAANGLQPAGGLAPGLMHLPEGCKAGGSSGGSGGSGRKRQRPDSLSA